MHDIEVDQQSDRLLGQLQIGKQLGFVDRRDPLDRLQFHYDRVLHQQIDPVPGVDLHAVIDDGQNGLGSYLQPSPGQFVPQARLVCTLQKARSERRMHLYRRLDHSPRYLVDLHPPTLCAVCDYEFTTEGTENTEVITEVNQYSGPIPQDTEHRGRPVLCATPVSSASSVIMSSPQRDRKSTRLTSSN